jgi:hypothetical protein
MSGVVPRWLVTTAALAATAGAAFVGGVAPGGDSDQEVVLTTLKGSSGYGTYGFDIKASSVKGLVPGSRKRISLTFSNPYAFPIRVTAVEGKTIATSRRSCTPKPENLKVEPYAGHLPMTISPRSRKGAGGLTLYMPNSVSNSCQGVTFTIRINGRATKAGR